MQQIEYFYSAHSAFAYLGSMRLMAIAQATGRQLLHKPMDLGKVVASVYPEGFRARSAAHRAYYFGREIERWAEYRDVPFKGGVPANHSKNVTLANSILIAGQQQGQCVDLLAHAFMQAHWEDHADLSDKQTLVSLIEGVGFDAASLIETSNHEEVRHAYKSNTAEAIERSVFGSPTYFVDGDMFYGQDRLELVERALEQPFARTWPA